MSVEMEDNIFEPTTSRNYQTMDNCRQSVPEIYVVNKRRLQAIRAGQMATLVLVALQAVSGVACNSLCVIADAGRLLADFLEQHRYSQIDTPIFRKFEVIAIFGSSIAVFLINAACCFFSTRRLYSGSFVINEPWLYVGAGLSLTTNAILVFVHYKSDWDSRRPPGVRHMWENKRREILHGIINHGFGITIVIVAFLVNYKYYVADAIGTYVVSLFTACNLASAIVKVRREYRTFKFFQENYENLDEHLVY